MLKRALVVGLGAVLLSGIAAPALAANPKPGLDTGSTNGGDNGWGNCGHNSSGGIRPNGTLNGLPTPNRGNGGYSKGDACVIVTWTNGPEQGDYITVDLRT